MDNKKRRIDDLFGFADICEADNYLIYGSSCCGAYTPNPNCPNVHGNECYDGGAPKPTCSANQGMSIGGGGTPTGSK